MTDHDFIDQIGPYLAGELTGDRLARFEAHLASSPAARAELAGYQATWLALDQLSVPAPSPQVRERFRALLAGYQQGLASRPARWWQGLLPPVGGWAPAWARVAWGVGLLVVGLWVGAQWRPGQSQAEAQIAQLTTEVQQMREIVMLTLLEKSSATERLRAVSLASEMPQPNPKVVEALLETLQNDSNLNVRIAAVETLLQFADQPKAREGLIRALGQQESPLVQVALIDAIVSLRASQAVPQLQKLLKDQNTNELVRDKVKSGLDILI
jgi:D-ribose pyranose/furanose isomerase RbsD